MALSLHERHWGWCQDCGQMIHRAYVQHGFQYWVDSQENAACGDVVHQPWLIADFADDSWTAEQVIEQLRAGRG
jgi:hypothetical protein